MDFKKRLRLRLLELWYEMIFHLTEVWYYLCHPRFYLSSLSDLFPPPPPDPPTPAEFMRSYPRSMTQEGADKLKAEVLPYDFSEDDMSQKTMRRWRFDKWRKEDDKGDGGNRSMSPEDSQIISAILEHSTSGD